MSVVFRLPDGALVAPDPAAAEDLPPGAPRILPYQVVETDSRAMREIEADVEKGWTEVIEAGPHEIAFAADFRSARSKQAAS